MQEKEITIGRITYNVSFTTGSWGEKTIVSIENMNDDSTVHADEWKDVSSAFHAPEIVEERMPRYVMTEAGPISVG